MFLGHFAAAFAAKRAAPAVSLGTLFLSCQLADLIWPNLVLAGIERVAVVPGITVVTPLDFEYYPYSHSLLMMALWALLAAVIYRVVRRQAPAAAVVVVAALVVSHWVLDVVSHRLDVPLVPGGSVKLGLELWRSRVATIAVETGMLAAGVALYASTTRAADRIGVYAFWGLVGFLLAINTANMFGPPPPGAAEVAWTAEALWLLVAWGYWVDRHRVVKRPA
jgi:uncharacterized membrane protein